MAEQFARDARIFAGDDMRSFQCFQRAQGDIAQIADGGGDQQ